VGFIDVDGLDVCIGVAALVAIVVQAGFAVFLLDGPEEIRGNYAELYFSPRSVGRRTGSVLSSTHKPSSTVQSLGAR
jgi:hypothetical protein